MSAKTSRAGIWGVGRSSRDQFFRIPHAKIVSGLKNEFHANRMFFDDFVEKIFLRDLFLPPLY